MIGRFFDCASLRATPVHSTPFRFALWRQPLHAAMAARLSALYPTEGFTPSERSGGGDKTYRFDVLRAVDKGRRLPAFAALAPDWQAFVAALSSPAYLQLMGELLDMPLAGHVVDVGFFTFHAGNAISIHRDHPGKTLTNVLYFSPAWQGDWGGELALYQRADDGAFTPFAQLQPAGNQGLVLVPGPASWHGVNAVSPAAAGPRLTLQVEAWPAPAGGA